MSGRIDKDIWKAYENFKLDAEGGREKFQDGLRGSVK